MKEERERLARRAAAGDLASARRLVAMLEAESGKTPRRETDVGKLRKLLFAEWSPTGSGRTPMQRASRAMREALLEDWTRMIVLEGRPFGQVAGLMPAITAATRDRADEFLHQLEPVLGQIADRVVRTRDGDVGVKTGGRRHPCRIEGCAWPQYGIRWPDGDLTWVCERSLVRLPDGTWQIGD